MFKSHTKKIFFLSLFFYFEREREREHKQGGAEREGEREYQVGSALSAQSLMGGSSPQTVRSLPELKSRVGGSTD